MTVAGQDALQLNFVNKVHGGTATAYAMRGSRTTIFSIPVRSGNRPHCKFGWAMYESACFVTGRLGAAQGACSFNPNPGDGGRKATLDTLSTPRSDNPSQHYAFAPLSTSSRPSRLAAHLARQSPGCGYHGY